MWGVGLDGTQFLAGVTARAGAPQEGSPPPVPRVSAARAPNFHYMITALRALHMHARMRMCQCMHVCMGAGQRTTRPRCYASALACCTQPTLHVQDKHPCAWHASALAIPPPLRTRRHPCRMSHEHRDLWHYDLASGWRRMAPVSSPGSGPAPRASPARPSRQPNRRSRARYPHSCAEPNVAAPHPRPGERPTQGEAHPMAGPTAHPDPARTWRASARQSLSMQAIRSRRTSGRAAVTSAPRASYGHT